MNENPVVREESRTDVSDEPALEPPSKAVKKESEVIPAENEAEILFELGVAMMLTNNYEEAAECFAKLRELGADDVALINNQGVNQLMYGLSMITEEEAEELIKFTFPFEVAPSRKGDKGHNERIAAIRKAFETSLALFNACIQKDPAYTTGWVNVAAAHILLERWKGAEADYSSAFDYLEKAQELAQELAKDLGQMTSLGHAQIIEGILYDYEGDTVSRNQMFERAAQNARVQVQHLVRHNQQVAHGGSTKFVAYKGEKFDELSPEEETIEGIELRPLFRGIGASSGLEWSTVSSMGNAEIYHHAFPNSDLYLFQKTANEFFAMQKTGINYSSESTLGVKIDYSEDLLRQNYGLPARIQAASNGKYLYYKNARIIFYIGSNGTVEHWMLTYMKKPMK